MKKQSAPSPSKKSSQNGEPHSRAVEHDGHGSEGFSLSQCLDEIDFRDQRQSGHKDAQKVRHSYAINSERQEGGLFTNPNCLTAKA